MRKGDIVEGTIEEIRFPNRGIFHLKDAQKDSAGNVIGDVEVAVKNGLPGQEVSVRITKKHPGRAEGTILHVVKPAPCEREAACPEFGKCGGCLYLTFPEEEELRIKEGQVRRLLAAAENSRKAGGAEDPQKAAGTKDPHVTSQSAGCAPDCGKMPEWYQGILQSPVTEGYRNKMELTFGDEVKDGPMTLGMHSRGSFYDVTNAENCRIVNEDFRKIIRATRDYWTGTGAPFYHRMQQQGYLRHLLIREGMKTGEILVDLVTTGQTDLLGENGAAEKQLLNGWLNRLTGLELDGSFAGILHTRNDSIADVVEDQGTETLYGRSSFEEELLGLRFTVTPFSFFQTNSYGAELLYETARKMISGAVRNMENETESSKLSADAGHVQGGNREYDPEAQGPCRRKPVIYDLYCGTGTISQLAAPVASEVIGVEIVKEAVRAARENAEKNHIGSCRFIAGDVLKVLDSIEEKPDLIILDPPRDGVHPKALPKIVAYGVPYLLYISCKPTSLARDLPLMRLAGYEPVQGVSVNQFPKTTGIETVVLLSNTRNFRAESVKGSTGMDDCRKIRNGEEDAS